MSWYSQPVSVCTDDYISFDWQLIDYNLFLTEAVWG